MAALEEETVDYSPDAGGALRSSDAMIARWGWAWALIELETGKKLEFVISANRQRAGSVAGGVAT